MESPGTVGRSDHHTVRGVNVDAQILPDLSGEFAPTRATLHAYAQAVGAVPRAHGIAHPKWWHVSLEVRPEGLTTHPIPLPTGGVVALTMDLHHHRVVIRSSEGMERTIDMRSGATGTEMGDAIIGLAAELGLEDGYDRARFESDEARSYDPAAAEAYFDAFVAVSTVFERRRVTLGERVGPVQLWPHGFDLAFEWFGTRIEQHDGEELPAQLNLGFFPGADPYFYSNPWPFDEDLIRTPLPHGAVWVTGEFRGTMLPYRELQGDPHAESKLLDYARAVFDAAAPTLGTS
jgi:hypothetical protein